MPIGIRHVHGKIYKHLKHESFCSSKLFQFCIVEKWRISSWGCTLYVHILYSHSFSQMLKVYGMTQGIA